MVAAEELGAGEDPELGNNRGAQVWKYTRARTSGAWCAAFVCWVFEIAADRCGMMVPFARTHSARRLYHRVGKAGRYSLVPVVGAVACWDRGLYPRAHCGIVTVAPRDGRTFETIEGNVGSLKRTRGQVARFDRHTVDDRLLGFAVL